MATTHSTPHKGACSRAPAPLPIELVTNGLVGALLAPATLTAIGRVDSTIRWLRLSAIRLRNHDFITAPAGRGAKTEPLTWFLVDLQQLLFHWSGPGCRVSGGKYAFLLPRRVLTRSGPFQTQKHDQKHQVLLKQA